MKQIIKEIFQDPILTEEELNLIIGKFHQEYFKKNELVIQPEKRIDKIYFVHKGCLRSYFLDTAGKEHTLQFAIKGWWISDYIALYGRDKTTAVSYIECIKDSEIYSIKKSDFDKLILNNVKLAQTHIRKMELAFASFQKRILDNLNLSATERYSNFIRQYPSIEKDIKNYHLASYLGIATESLSRIRKKLSINECS